MESKKYLVFNDELHTMSQYASQSEVASRLGIAETQQNQLIEYQKQFDAEMQLYNNPATKTVVITKQVGESYKTTHAWIADFRQAVKHGNKGDTTPNTNTSTMPVIVLVIVLVIILFLILIVNSFVYFYVMTNEKIGLSVPNTPLVMPYRQGDRYDLDV
jgi:DNA-binding transcriptional regulator YdaS (Cro superfamily)